MKKPLSPQLGVAFLAGFALAGIAAVSLALTGCDSNLSAEQKAVYYKGQAVKLAHDDASGTDVYAMQVPNPETDGHQTIYIAKSPAGATTSFEEHAGRSTHLVVAHSR